MKNFKGFLIPGLDYGHGSFDDEMNLNEIIGDKWERYLFKIGQKVRQNKDDKTEAKRIVFIDKFVLDVFLKDYKRVIQLADIKTDGSLIFNFSTTDDKHSLKEFGRFIIRLVFYTMKIHNACWRDRNDIDCFYSDKSEVNSTQYYDFGLYEFKGKYRNSVKVVYNPVYLKGIGKNLVRDQLYIGTTKTQKNQIAAFEKDFDNLWKICETQHRQYQSGNSERAEKDSVFHEKYYGGEIGKYYEQRAYELYEFECGYFNKIKTIFEQELNYHNLNH